MKNRHERARLREARKITAELDKLEARDLDTIRHDQPELISEHIDAIDKVGRLIDGFGSDSLSRWANRLYGQAVRCKRELEDAAEYLTWA